MITITANNVNDALYQGLMFFREDVTHCHIVQTRGQRRIVAPQVWITEYLRPWERVLYHPIRDANPFFHLMDGLYMLSGRTDVRWLERWLPRVKEYSDDGERFYGAYGDRLRHKDQLYLAIQRLKKDRHSSRAVLALYHPSDAEYQGKDLPCNCTVALDIKNGMLHMTVFNRSNDMLWGAYGANAVQFSMLQEFIAAMLKVPMGVYTQMSHNTHIYPDTDVCKRLMTSKELPIPEMYDMYHQKKAGTYPLVEDPNTFLRDLTQFMRSLDHDVLSIDNPFACRNTFFQEVAWPMALSYWAHRQGDYELRDSALQLMPETIDWRIAAEQWYERHGRALVKVHNSPVAVH